MSIKEIAVNFITGGALTTLIVGLEESGHRTLSGLATLVPVFTLISYIFIGESRDGDAVGAHSKFILTGPLISWVPYMMVISFLAPKIGPNKAIAGRITRFFRSGGAFVCAIQHFRWLQ